MEITVFKKHWNYFDLWKNRLDRWIDFFVMWDIQMYIYELHTLKENSIKVKIGKLVVSLFFWILVKNNKSIEYKIHMSL